MNRALALLVMAQTACVFVPTAAARSDASGVQSPDSQALGVAAREARRDGRLFTAAWATERALRLSPVAPIATHEAARLGWEVTAPAGEGALPSPWPWWLVGLSAWLALLAAAWALRDRLGLLALAVAAIASAVALPSAEVAPPTLPEVLVQPFDVALCPTQSVYWEGGRLVIEATCQGRAARWTVIGELSSGQYAAQTAHHTLGGGSTLDAPELGLALQTQLVTALQSAEESGYRVPVEESWVMPRTRLWRGADPAQRAQLQVAAGVVAGALVVILFGLWTLATSLLRASRTRPLLWVLLGLSIVGLCVVPGRMRMMYSGYHLTQHLVDGSIPRYGPGAIWFYGPVQWLLGGDHAWVQWANRVYGLGCGIATVALAGLWFNRTVATVTAVLASALPFFWFAYSCESIHVAPTLAVLVAVGVLSLPERRAPVAAAIAVIAAGLTRPEIAAVMCLAPLWLWCVQRCPRPTRRAWPWLVALVAIYGVIGWRMLDVLVLSDQLAAQGAVASPGRWLERGWYAFSLGGVFMSPDYLPPVLGGLLVIAAATPSHRRIALPTLAFGAVWLASAGIDYAYVSLIRLQLPVVLLWLPLMAAACVTIYRWPRGKALAVALTALMLAGSATSFLALDVRTVEDDEDQLWRDAVTALPDGPGCLVTHIYGDEASAAKTPRFVPRYLLASLRPEVSIHPLRTLPDVARTCAGPVYFLRGSRCYADLRRPGEPAPPEGTDYCTSAPPAAHLTPLIERDVKNVGVVSYPMYPAGERLRLGLYRLTR
ncbi:MAG: hypothetical protein ACPGU1_03195 [Myxococcota bacterium]